MTQETTEYTVAELNCETNTTTYRSMTAEEVTAYEKLRADALVAEAERETAKANREALKESARTKLVAGEPLTEEEAAVLVI
jgi:hypothetical protein